MQLREKDINMRIGLIGGVSWASTMEYYFRLNRRLQVANPGHQSADLVLVSLDFSIILATQQSGDEKAEFEILFSAAQDLKRAGAKRILICSNTTSSLCDRLQEAVGVPFVNIIDSTITAVQATGAERVGLLGTKFVMERGFYKQRFGELGIDVLVPEKPARDKIHSAIYNELCRYDLTPDARSAMDDGMHDLAKQKVDAIILGCTEIPLVMRNIREFQGIPVIDSIDAHIDALTTQPKLEARLAF